MGAAGDARIDALREDVRARGWIVFAAHPAEVATGKLIKSMKRRGPLDLYLARPDGSQLRNITRSNEYHEFGGRFSPDRTKLLYRRLTSSATINHDRWGAMGQLVIADANGSNPQPVGRPGELPWASWSPDMNRFACLYRKHGKIRIVDTQTRQIVRELSTQGIYQQLFWSPDGKRLVGTANRAGRQWNVVSINLATEKLTVLTRALNCTPDWFQGNAERVIYSNRNPALFPGKYNNYGLTMLMQATADGRRRRLIYGNVHKHVYYGCTSPDDRYIIFADDPGDNLVVGELRVIRLADTPIIPAAFNDLKPLYPNANDGPVLDLQLPNGASLRGFEPHWTYAELSGAR